MKGIMRFGKHGKHGKLSLRYSLPFEILKAVGVMTYKLILFLRLSGFYLIFHVFILKNYHCDDDCIIHWDSVLLDENIYYKEEHVVILYRDIHILWTKEIISVNV